MNKHRRERLADAAAKIDTAVDEIANVIFDEQDALLGVPANLQNSERYYDAENAVDTMQGTVDELNDIAERLREL